MWVLSKVHDILCICYYICIIYYIYMYIIYIYVYIHIYIIYIYIYLIFIYYASRMYIDEYVIIKRMRDVFNDFSCHCDHCFSCSDMNLSQC